jgi:hypothetical protein
VADPQQPEISGRPRLANAHHDRDLSLSPDGHRALSAHRVFVSDEGRLDVSFPVAQARLVSLIRGGLLCSASAQAYGEGITGLARFGRPRSAPGLSRLVQVHVQYLTASGDSGRVALRWEAEGPAGGLFSALDADITLALAGERAATLTLTGVYRSPPGIASPELDRAIVLRCATATIQAFLRHVIEAIAVAGEPGTEAADPRTP